MSWARVFEAATGTELSRMTEDYPVNAVAFSPDSSDTGRVALITRSFTSVPRYILTATILEYPNPAVIVYCEPLRKDA